MNWSPFLIIFGVSVVSYLLVYISFKLDEEHTLLRILTLMFAVVMMVMIPAVTVNENRYCDILLLNETVNGNETTYNYNHTCFDSPYNTPQTFNKIMLGYLLVFILYITIYYAYTALRFANDAIGRKKYNG